jgi:hypothetical protein
MYLAQGIKKRWELEKINDNDNNKIAPLSYLIELEYKKYKELCFWTYQKPLSKGKWLLQIIEPIEN